MLLRILRQAIYFVLTIALAGSLAAQKGAKGGKPSASPGFNKAAKGPGKAPPLKASPKGKQGKPVTLPANSKPGKQPGLPPRAGKGPGPLSPKFNEKANPPIRRPTPDFNKVAKDGKKGGGSPPPLPPPAPRPNLPSPSKRGF